MSRLSTFAITFATLALLALGCQPSEVRVTPIRVSDNGGGMTSTIDLAEVQDWVDDVNDTWLWDFQVHPAGLHDISSTTLNTAPDTDAKWQAYDNTAHWAVATTFLGNGLPVFFRARNSVGFSGGPTVRHYVSMPSWDNANGNATLLSHEIGHYFGLAHTHADDLACTELSSTKADGDANGQRNDVTWDDIDDTPADPGEDCVTNTPPTCNVNATAIIGGVTYSPPWTNLMSYHDCVPETMSGGQLGVVGKVSQDGMRGYVFQD